MGYPSLQLSHIYGLSESAPGPASESNSQNSQSARGGIIFEVQCQHAHDLGTICLLLIDGLEMPDRQAKGRQKASGGKVHTIRSDPTQQKEINEIQASINCTCPPCGERAGGGPWSADRARRGIVCRR